MITSPNIPMFLNSSLFGDQAPRLQGEVKQINPIMLRVSRATTAWDQGLSDETELARNAQYQRMFSAPMLNAAQPREVSADSTPLQIWEGTVIEVDNAAKIMRVLLDAKIGNMPRHSGEIDLEWVSEQDRNLVRPGAVFYLTLFKRTKRGSIENSQELRFRRRPSWSAAQLEQIEANASMLLSKMKVLPTSA